MDTIAKLTLYARKINSDIKFIGVPKTIDNDLMCTDHTPGYGSTAKYIAGTMKEIILDASVYDKKSVTVVEIMGRAMRAGSLARRRLPFPILKTIVVLSNLLYSWVHRTFRLSPQPPYQG